MHLISITLLFPIICNQSYLYLVTSETWKLLLSRLTLKNFLLSFDVDLVLKELMKLKKFHTHEKPFFQDRNMIITLIFGYIQVVYLIKVHQFKVLTSIRLITWKPCIIAFNQNHGNDLVVFNNMSKMSWCSSMTENYFSQDIRDTIGISILVSPWIQNQF